MNIHEYQAKQILKDFQVHVPCDIVACTPEEAVIAAQKIEADTGIGKWAIKAQVHAGGRGKAGGVKIAASLEEVKEMSTQILGMTLVNHQTGPQGKYVRKVLISPNIYYEGESPIREFYIGILLDRSTGRNIIMYSPDGGVDIEEVAAKNPERIFKEEINPALGLCDFQARTIAFNLGLEGKAFKSMIPFIKALYNAYIGCDASLLEINPTLKSSDDQIIAADAKIQLDDNALFRHPQYADMLDKHEEDPAELEANEHHLNFVKLDGNVGCMVNGAGLAMGTMDMINLSGGKPANFLDIGGGANAVRVEKAFNIILKDDNVRAILINIFGGIVRCDRVAAGIIEAYNKLGNIKVPVIVRLQGTNATEAKHLIQNSGLQVHTAITLEEAAQKIKEVLK